MLQEDSMQLFMCGNGIRSWDQFETVLTHELIHAYDHCRAEIDPVDLRHHACMEVRASNLSGDCAFKREAKLGELEITAHQPVSPSIHPSIR
jgi:inner membrane protease ATP23